MLCATNNQDYRIYLSVEGVVAYLVCNLQSPGKLLVCAVCSTHVHV
jgi:hypothetical protein